MAKNDNISAGFPTTFSKLSFKRMSAARGCSLIIYTAKMEKLQVVNRTSPAFIPFDRLAMMIMMMKNIKPNSPRPIKTMPTASRMASMILAAMMYFSLSIFSFFTRIYLYRFSAVSVIKYVAKPTASPVSKNLLFCRISVNSK